ncbi:hypothetical protein QYM36_010007, partial [Artemia franciscana]
HTDVRISPETYRQILKTMNISLKMPASDPCLTCERYLEKYNHIDADDEELPEYKPDISWKDEWLLLIDMTKKATHKYQEDASKNETCPPSLATGICQIQGGSRKQSSERKRLLMDEEGNEERLEQLCKIRVLFQVPVALKSCQI